MFLLKFVSSVVKNKRSTDYTDYTEIKFVIFVLSVGKKDNPAHQVRLVIKTK